MLHTLLKTAFIACVFLTFEVCYLRAGGPSFAQSFDPKIAQEVGTKVRARKYGLRNANKIPRGLERRSLTSLINAHLRQHVEHVLLILRNMPLL